MALNPSPQRQSVVTFPTPNVNDILFFETVDAERIGTDVPEYGTKHPDYKRWPDHRLVHIEAADDQSRYYRYYYAADQIDQDDDNWAFSKADIGGTKFDAVTREYVIRRSEFDPATPAMGAAMPDVPEGKFDGTHVLAERKQIPISDKVLNGLYVIEQRTYVKKVPLYRLDYDEFFRTTNYTKQTLYYTSEVPEDQSLSISALVADTDNAYWKMTSGIVRTAQQLSDNWYAVTEQQVVNCSAAASLEDLQTTARQSVIDATEYYSSSSLNLFSTYTSSSNLVRNVASWAHKLKGITAFVAWNSNSAGGGKRIGGVAITKRHVLFAAHAAYVEDEILYFVSKENVIHSRTIKEVERHPNWSVSAPTTWDYGVAVLDSDLPDDIEVIKVLPKDCYRYFQSDDFSSETVWSSPSAVDEEVLVLTTDQDENAHIRKLQSLSFGSVDFQNPSETYTNFTLSDASGYSSWTEPLIDGDSGSVAAMVIDGECVLLGLLSTTTPNGGFVSSPRGYDDINALIAEVDAEYEASSTEPNKYYSSNYKLTPFELANTYADPSTCASFTYETVVTYDFPPILNSVEFDVWNLRSGGAKTYPRVLYSKGPFRGPCRAVVSTSWSTSQPSSVPQDDKPEPEPIVVQNPMFTLSIPPSLHEAVTLNVSVGDSDETYDSTTATYTKGATNVTSWKPHVASSEVKPFRGGWIIETTTVYPPSE